MQLPAWLLKRRVDTHKGDFGHIFIVGGSVGLTGAVCLAAEAGLKIGAGLVTVGVPLSLNTIFEIKLTEVMSLPLSETKNGALSEQAYPQIEEFIKKIDVLVVGCGASRQRSTQQLILKIIRHIEKPIIVDADGLNALVEDLEVLKARKEKVILTPHLGEFSRLVKQNLDYVKKERKKLAKEFAFRYNLILVVKGYHTIVTDGDMIFENETGNPGMATAGSGDVLAGIIGGLVAQGASCWEAAKIGVFLHGLAADIAAEEKTQLGMVASDIIEYLPLAIKKAGGIN